MKIILIMGLPGSGKTTLASELAPLINAKRINADEVRRAHNDWDFSEEARKRQAKRMADLAIKQKQEGN
jgi:adenylylsulfate kinase